MALPTLMVFTHDAMGDGEDGPTHQPIEQLASLRAIPGMTLPRPGDANEVVEAYRSALAAEAPPDHHGVVGAAVAHAGAQPLCARSGRRQGCVCAGRCAWRPAAADPAAAAAKSSAWTHSARQRRLRRCSQEFGFEPEHVVAVAREVLSGVMAEFTLNEGRECGVRAARRRWRLLRPVSGPGVVNSTRRSSCTEAAFHGGSLSDMEEPMPEGPRGRLLHGWLIGIAVALLSIFALVTAYEFLEHRFPNWLDWWPDISITEIKRYIQDSGKWGMAISIGLMVAHSFLPLPSEAITLANGMIYGAVTGGVLTWVGAMLGAQAAYWPARTLGRVALMRHIDPERLARITRWIDSNCVIALLGMRLIPMISFNLVNYVAGLANVSWWTFTWTTALGILPFTILLVVLGQNASTLSAEMWMAVGGVGALSLVVAWRVRRG